MSLHAAPTLSFIPVEELRRQADLGDVPAKARLGERLLIGMEAPHDPQAAVGYLSEAAEQGDAEALGHMATLAGVGALMPQNWTVSLAYLERSAALGSKSASAQIEILAAAPPTPPDEAAKPETWRRLTATIDVAAWTAPPERRAVCESPRVRMADKFAPASVCDWLISRAEGRMRAAMMYDGTTKTEQVDPHRTCSDYQFDILNTDVVLALVREKIAATTRLPTPAMEPPRVFHYALGEQIKPHYDRCGDGVEGYGREGGYLGDRIVTFLLYLNEGFEGGELDFPKVGFRCKGAKGDAVYFAHVDPSGRPDPLSLHAGLTITAGEKWVLSQWIHDRPFGVPEPHA